MVGDPRPSTGTQWGRHRPSGDTSPSTVTEGGGDGRNRLPPGSQTPTPGTPTGGRPTPGPTEREHVHSRLFFDCPSWHPYARSHLWSGDEAHSGPRPQGPGTLSANTGRDGSRRQTRAHKSVDAVGAVLVHVLGLRLYPELGPEVGASERSLGDDSSGGRRGTLCGTRNVKARLRHHGRAYRLYRAT